MMESETIEMVKMMIEMRKLPNRVKGCPVWDKLTLDLWKDAVAGKIDSDEEFSIKSAQCMEHCETCRHPMCVKAIFGDTPPTTGGNYA